LCVIVKVVVEPSPIVAAYTLPAKPVKTVPPSVSGTNLVPLNFKI
jgi:hypothetical protein